MTKRKTLEKEREDLNRAGQMHYGERHTDIINDLYAFYGITFEFDLTVLNDEY